MKRTYAKAFFAVVALSLLVVAPAWMAWKRHMDNQFSEHEKKAIAEMTSEAFADHLMAEVTQRYGAPQALWIVGPKGGLREAVATVPIPFMVRNLTLPEAQNEFLRYGENGVDPYLEIIRVPTPERPRLDHIFVAFAFDLKTPWDQYSWLWAVAALLASCLISTIVFIRMAQKIELLVGKLKSTQSSRTQIIEELSHDLRTPLTSILTVFEAISDAKTLTPEFIRECVAVAVPEVEYVKRLIHDLFLLAQMGEPDYRPASKEVDLRTLIEEELRHFSSLFQHGEKPIQFEFIAKKFTEPSILADAHLLKRLVRNVVANAAQYAISKVWVLLESDPERSWKLTVSDDGAGFSSNSEGSFGENRPSMKGKSINNTSLGLGSVIVRRIVELNSGSLSAYNRIDPSGQSRAPSFKLQFR